MSAYAVVLEAVKANPNKTSSQLAALIPMEQVTVDQVLPMLVQDTRVTKTGTGGGATYAASSTQ